MYVLIINNKTKCRKLPMVAEFGFMWFLDVVFTILDGDTFLEIYILCNNTILNGTHCLRTVEVTGSNSVLFHVYLLVSIIKKMMLKYLMPPYHQV